MFKDLPPWRPSQIGLSDDAIRRAALKYCNEALTAADNAPRNNILIPAGYTYAGQLISHDLTPNTQEPGAPKAPRLNLDTLYGPDDRPAALNGAPPGSSAGCAAGFTGYFELGRGDDQAEQDLPRDAAGRARIADSRNDDNLLLSQLTLMLMRAHNRILNDLADNPDAPSQEEFENARQALQWLYQYLVCNDYLPRVLRGFRGQRDLPHTELSADTLPDLFTHAAFRFGHAMVKRNYLLNKTVVSEIGRVPIFDESAPDLRGRRPLPARHSLQWDWFFEFDSSFQHFPQQSRRITPALVPALAKVATPVEIISLPFVDLMHGIEGKLPAGSAIAETLGIDPLPVEDDLHFSDQPWVYLLREARTLEGGFQLGPVGSHILAQVFGTVLRADEDAYLNARPDWQPGDDPRLALKRPAFGARWTFADLVSLSGAPVSAGEIEQILNP